MHAMVKQTYVVLKNNMFKKDGGFYYINKSRSITPESLIMDGGFYYNKSLVITP